MNLILKIAFNSQTNTLVSIKNPQYIPELGEIVHIEPEDYFINPTDIKIIKSYAEKGTWRVGVKTVYFREKVTTVLIILEEDEHYIENRLSSGI